jgi:hypothetical protein
MFRTPVRFIVCLPAHRLSRHARIETTDASGTSTLVGSALCSTAQPCAYCLITDAQQPFTVCCVIMLAGTAMRWIQTHHQRRPTQGQAGGEHHPHPHHPHPLLPRYDHTATCMSDEARLTVWRQRNEWSCTAGVVNEAAVAACRAAAAVGKFKHSRVSMCCMQ